MLKVVLGKSVIVNSFIEAVIHQMNTERWMQFTVGGRSAIICLRQALSTSCVLGSLWCSIFNWNHSKRKPKKKNNTLSQSVEVRFPPLIIQSSYTKLSKKALRSEENFQSSHNPFSPHVYTVLIVAQSGGVHSSTCSVQERGYRCQMQTPKI